MFRVYAAFVLVVLLALPAAGSVLQGPPRVIDGDTFDLGGVRIRLQGVDAPERAEICRDAAGRDWDCGAWAGQQLQALLRGATLVCHDLGERTFNRTVARCEVDGHDLGALLIERGYVRACPRFAARHPHSRGYAALEAAAMERRIGLHAGQTPPRAGFCGPEAALNLASGPGAPRDCRIKGNISRSGERIFHLPGQRFYDATVIDTRRGERWFCSEAEARAAGWRRAQR